MSSLSLSRIGGWAALATVACFVAGIVAMVSSGVQLLIPETGGEGREWTEGAGDEFFVGAWPVVFGGLAVLVSFHAWAILATRVVRRRIGSVGGVVL